MKMINRKIISSELERGIISNRFLICLLGSIIMVILGTWDKFFLTKEMKETGLAAGYHYSMVLQALKSETAIFIIPILSTLSYSGNFLEEYKSRFDKLLLMRTDRKNYVISKVLTTGLSSGLGILLGTVIITGLLSLVFRPMEAKDVVESAELFTSVCQYIVIISLMGNLWGSLGALLGVWYRNAYMAYGGPFLVNYILIIIFTRYAPNIYVLNPREWLLQEHYDAADPLGIIVLILEISIIIQLLEGVAIWKKIKQS
ncbi:MAG: hypothetical protein K0S01_2681 [Herbinix sp.]|jgi:hypothetical protein|nr:hypothetical protein [Herbinix sp.]